MVGWRLFLDDDADTVRHPSVCVENPEWRANRSLPANPPDTSHLGPWRVARSVEEAIQLIALYGLPSFASFDHDLCDEREGYDGAMVVRHIIEIDMNTASLPVDFAYEVHSWNPTGAARIRDMLEGYLQAKRDGLISISDDCSSDRASLYNHLFGGN